MTNDFKKQLEEQRAFSESLERQIETIKRKMAEKPIEDIKNFVDVPFDPIRKIDNLTLKNIDGITKIRVRATDAQTISNLTDTKITFAAETKDALGEFASNRFTAKTPGDYLVIANLSTASAVDQKLFKMMVYKNGAKNSVAYVETSGTSVHTVNISDILYDIKANDYIELYFFQNTGGDINIESNSGVNGENSFLVIHKLS